MTHQEMIQAMKDMPNGERIRFLIHIRDNHFYGNSITSEEAELLEDLRDGYVKVVENAWL